jgi:hypothetical protein
MGSEVVNAFFSHLAIDLQVSPSTPLDFQRRDRTVRDGKGAKDRLTLLPQRLIPELRQHLLVVRQQPQADLGACGGIPAVACRAAIPSIPPWCRGRSNRPYEQQGSPKPPTAIPSAIPLPPICWSVAGTSAPSRSC